MYGGIIQLLSDTSWVFDADIIAKLEHPCLDFVDSVYDVMHCVMDNLVPATFCNHKGIVFDVQEQASPDERCFS